MLPNGTPLGKQRAGALPQTPRFFALQSGCRAWLRGDIGGRVGAADVLIPTPAAALGLLLSSALSSGPADFIVIHLEALSSIVASLLGLPL